MTSDDQVTPFVEDFPALEAVPLPWPEEEER